MMLLINAKHREKKWTPENLFFDSLIVARYDDLGQPVCRVCNVAVKSEAFWPAHLTSRLHKEAADRLKAQAKEAAVTACTGRQLDSTVATMTPKETSAIPCTDIQLDATVTTKAKSRISSSLPNDFWEQPQAKHASTDVPAQGSTSVPSEDEVVDDRSHKEIASSDALSKNDSDPLKPISTAEVLFPQPGQGGVMSNEGVQKSLPEGFFDNVDADYRARGLEPPKYNIQDEWKDFEKSIRDDLQEVDLRLEEEEFDAAEDREQLESLQQRELRDRVEKLKRKEHEQVETTEITEVIAKVTSRKPFMNVNLSLDEDSTTDGDSEDENALLDWRAKQFQGK
ncbi:hypothetical protein GOP47_0026362 [Adiantum capillus-veneris]|nr:hypothetical protein GOP47_0026362 [Adiantum capillus-veneris]